MTGRALGQRAQHTDDRDRFVTESRGAYQWPARTPAVESGAGPKAPAWICPTEPFTQVDVREGLERRLLFEHLGATDVRACFTTTSERMSAPIAGTLRRPATQPPASVHDTLLKKWEVDRQFSSREMKYAQSQAKLAYPPMPSSVLVDQIRFNRQTRDACRRQASHPPAL
ncbi:Uncharacterized protein PBTT_04614 [Plasmodiophora brassicae]